MAFSSQASRRIKVALGVAAVASSLGSTIGSPNRALAGPTLSNLINLSNSANVTVNNVAGQSFTVQGVLSSAITPFASAGALTLANTAVVSLSAASLGLNPLLGAAAGTFDTVGGSVLNGVATGIIELGSLTGVVLGALTATQSVSAAITNTVFGVSNVAATSAFTTQTTTSLTAF